LALEVDENFAEEVAVEVAEEEEAAGGVAVIEFDQARVDGNAV
jgi:hypothetical protein